ncbi:MAG: metal ABC transporter substrate-binding protein [Ruminococcus sp.]|nr:metal ABC transporter substrate-binding protein [Ruminococcus sp.]
MKKIVCLVIFLTLILSVFSGCNTEKNTQPNSDRLSIVTTIFPYYDFTVNIVGDKADVKLLLSPGAEPHDYDASPSDIVAIENCDIFIYNGGESDEWVDGIIESLENKSVKFIRMMDYIEPLCSDSHNHNEHNEHNHNERNEHLHEHEFDEHIWTSVNNAKKFVDVISENAQTCDINNAKLYLSNTEKYIAKLSALDDEFKSIMSHSQRDTIVLGDRFPLRYLANDYGIKYEAAFSGCNSETQPGISTITHLIDFVRDNNIPVVIYLDFSSGNIAKLLCEDSNAVSKKMWSCHNLTKSEFENGANYISLMKENTKVLREALF